MLLYEIKMTQKIFACLTCLDSTSDEMFKMFVFSSEGEYVVLTRRMDFSAVGVDFTYRTSDLSMVGYHLNSFFYDYNADDFSWTFEVYSASVCLNRPKFSGVNDLIVDLVPIMDFVFDINDYEMHLQKCFAFDDGITIISEDNTYDDLPDLIPLSLDEMTGILCSTENQQKDPPVELDKIYESGDEMVFIAN